MHEEICQLQILLGKAFRAGQLENIHYEAWLQRESKEFENVRFFKEIPTECIRKREVIKLDRNFHVYLHGEKHKMEFKEDEQGKYLVLRYTSAIQ